MRSTTKSWPTRNPRRARSPAFAEDPIAKVRLGWTLEQKGDFVNYRGIPTAPGGVRSCSPDPEPAPGGNEVLGPTAPPDETHHVLADGTVLHVTIWFRPAGASPGGEVVTRPFAEGFSQILTGGSP